MEQKTKILFTGPLPPPAGGISIHIWRLRALLAQEFDIDFIDEGTKEQKTYFNIRSYRFFTYLKKIAQTDVLYIQSGSVILRLMHLLTGKLLFKKMILTVHSYPWRKNKFARFMDTTIFSFAKKVILVNPDILDGIDISPDKYVIKNAFLPPAMAEEPLLPKHIEDWLSKARSENRFIVCANASRLDMYNNEDLYGLDMCIEAASILKQKGLAVNFLFTVSSLENCRPVFEKNSALIKEKKLQEHFLLINERLPFVRVIEKADLVLRPTNTDGDALTIREGIYLGKKTMASDIVERPAETILFKNRDVNDMVSKLQAAISEKRQAVTDAVNNTATINNEYKKFYTDLVKNVAGKKTAQGYNEQAVYSEKYSA